MLNKEIFTRWLNLTEQQNIWRALWQSNLVMDFIILLFAVYARWLWVKRRRESWIQSQSGLRERKSGPSNLVNAAPPFVACETGRRRRELSYWHNLFWFHTARLGVSFLPLPKRMASHRALTLSSKGSRVELSSWKSFYSGLGTKAIYFWKVAILDDWCWCECHKYFSPSMVW